MKTFILVLLSLMFVVCNAGSVFAYCSSLNPAEFNACVQRENQHNQMMQMQQQQMFMQQQYINQQRQMQQQQLEMQKQMLKQQRQIMEQSKYMPQFYQ